MSWRVAESLKKLREQINAAYPNRDKASDGSIGDAAHAVSTSDHNPWVKDASGQGVVTAIDIDEDLTPNISTVQLQIDAIIASRDPRVKYIIYEGRMCSSYPARGYKAWTWRPYSGVNPHSQHAHISVNPAPYHYDSRAEWSIGSLPVPGEVAESVSLATALLKRGSKGPAVGRLQNQLIALGYSLKADNDFGPATERAVKGFQLEKGLRPDGMAGPNTFAALADAKSLPDLTDEKIEDLLDIPQVSAADPPPNVIDAQEPPAEPAGDPPNARPSFFVTLEDWKPFVARWLKRVWALVPAFNGAQATALVGAAVSDPPNWFIYVAIAAAVLLLTGGLAIFVTLILVAVWLWNRYEISNVFRQQNEIRANPNLKNFAAEFEKK